MASVAAGRPDESWSLHLRGWEPHGRWSGVATSCTGRTGRWWAGL